MNDDANPQGIVRPRLAVKKIAQDDPKTSRPMVSVHTKAKTGGRPRLPVAIGQEMPINRPFEGRPRLPVGGSADTPTKATKGEGRPPIPVGPVGSLGADTRPPITEGRVRPSIPVGGEGISPAGVQRPTLKVRTQDENPQKKGAPYDQDLDPDDAEY